MDQILRYPSSISFKLLPEELRENYDVMHLRFFVTIASDDNVDVVIGQLKGIGSR